MREIDRRIRYLQKRMPDLKIVDTVLPNPDQIFFGAWVTLEDAAGIEVTYRIVGADELDSEKGWISLDSPLAKALLKRLVDDEIQVRTPSGMRSYIIIEVSYSAAS